VQCAGPTRRSYGAGSGGLDFHRLCAEITRLEGCRREHPRISWLSVEWLALAVWGIVAMVAMPLGSVSILGKAWPVEQATAAGAGFVLVLLYIVTDGVSSLAWIAMGAGAAGALTCTSGAASLTAGGPGQPTLRVAAIEETSALALGVVLPLFVVSIPLTLLVALGIGTTS
jgi:hypothetical protein